MPRLSVEKSRSYTVVRGNARRNSELTPVMNALSFGMLIAIDALVTAWAAANLWPHAIPPCTWVAIGFTIAWMPLGLYVWRDFSAREQTPE